MEEPTEHSQHGPEQPQATITRSRDTTATTNAKALYQPSDDDKLYRLLFGQGEFTPTANMCRLVVEYIAQPEDLSPMQILKKQGHAKQNWYQWQQSHPGFLQWWNAVIEDVIRDEHLSGLYLQLMKRARTHDTGAAKLLMQRFDIKYTERSQQDNRLSFQGYDPPAADRSRERQRKALAEQAQALPVVEVDAREALPEPIPSNADAPDDNTPTGAIRGDAPLSTPSTPALQAQSQSIEHEQPEPMPPSNDETLDIKPITQQDPQGGDLK